MSEHVLIMNSDADWFVSQLLVECPNFRYSAADTPEQAMELAPDADILIGLAPALSDPLLNSMQNLKWVHALTTGVDNLARSPKLALDIFLSNSRGFHGPQMSELAVLLMLSTLRDYPRILENQKAKQWERWPQPLLFGKSACIVGLGSIAEALIDRLLAFDMTLTGVSDGRSNVHGITRIYPRSELPTAAGDTDFLIILVPYMSSTHHLIDDEVISQMRPDSILINLSRGGCLDEDALEKHLKARTIRAAALDVFEHEPLPSDSSLWDTPGITLTPHIGGVSDIYREQVLPSVIKNLKAWAKGGGPALPDLVKREELI